MIYVSLIVHNQKKKRKRNLNMITFIPISCTKTTISQFVSQSSFFYILPLWLVFNHQLIFPRNGNDHQKTDITL